MEDLYRIMIVTFGFLVFFTIVKIMKYYFDKGEKLILEEEKREEEKREERKIGLSNYNSMLKSAYEYYNDNKGKDMDDQMYTIKAKLVDGKEHINITINKIPFYSPYTKTNKYNLMFVFKKPLFVKLIELANDVDCSKNYNIIYDEKVIVNRCTSFDIIKRVQQWLFDVYTSDHYDTLNVFEKELFKIENKELLDNIEIKKICDL